MQLKEDEIVSIEYIGEGETGDIEILDAEGEHQRNYFANGINVHNSGAMSQYPAYKFKLKEQQKAEHPIIDKWTEDTYGLIIYQEQVMQIVRELGDFDWAQTNTVRKVMSKSGGAEYFMKTFWPQWKKGCNEKGMDDETAEQAFKRIMSFGSWAFNASHSCAYAFVSYFCMWFKLYYPVEYITAYLNTISAGRDKERKIKEMIREAQRLGIEVREPDVSFSKDKFVIKDGKIISGLSDIKNVGSKAIQSIVQAQPFNGLADFMERIDRRACNKRVMESLIKAGAMDSFGYSKKQLLENMETIVKESKKKTDRAREKVGAILSNCRGEDFNQQEQAQLKATITPISLGKHVSEYYDDVVEKFDEHIKVTKLIDIELDEGEQQKEGRDIVKLDVYVVGLITHVDLKRLSQEVKDVIDVAEEKRYALVNMEDETDFVCLSFRGSVYERYEQNLHNWVSRVVLVKGIVNKGWKKVYVEKVWEMDYLREYIKGGCKPWNFVDGYLFKHPLKRYLGDDIKSVKAKYRTHDLRNINKLRIGASMWTLGIITDMVKFTISKGDNKGKYFYWVFYEDETFQGSFMISPSDKRFKEMESNILQIYEQKLPVILRVQRDIKYMENTDPNVRMVSISIDKRIKWETMIKMPFKVKNKETENV